MLVHCKPETQAKQDEIDIRTCAPFFTTIHVSWKRMKIYTNSFSWS